MTRTLYLIAAIAILALGIVTLGPAACSKIRSLTAQSRVETGQSGAARKSAEDAIGTQGAAGARETASEKMTRDNERNIRDADGAKDAVNPAVDAAGRRALCLRDAYRDDAKCRVFVARPR